MGAKIAELYAVLYGSDHAKFAEASQLRAQAAHLRDTGGADADWPQIEELLRQSYRELMTGW